MHSTHNEVKYVIAKRFTRTLKNKIYKYILSISKNVCINYFIVGRGVLTPLFYEDPQYITYLLPFSNFVDFFLKRRGGGDSNYEVE